MKRGGAEGRRVIVVRRRARHHEEHHGGSWKVAYADFVTAMMAFFLVMWILGMDAGVKDLVQGYFSDPSEYRSAGAAGRQDASGRAIHLGIRPVPTLSFEEQRSSFERIAVALSRRLASAAAMQGLDAVTEVMVTDQGLRIELMDTGDGRGLFDRGSAAVRPGLRELVSVIASELAPLPNGVILEGHTDARPFGSGRYSNWELSVDRANAARRALLDGGMVAEHRILEVRGYATGRPRVPQDLYDPRNRRISLLLPYAEGPDLRPLAGSGIPASPR